jgi:hypothetical protein
MHVEIDFAVDFIVSRAKANYSYTFLSESTEIMVFYGFFNLVTFSLTVA